MLTIVQCPCGFRVSARSVRSASFSLEAHVTRERSGIGVDRCEMQHAKLVDRQPLPGRSGQSITVAGLKL